MPPVLPEDHPDAPPETGYDVLVVGGTGVDTIVRVDELTIPGGDYSGVPPIRDYVAHTGNGVALGFHALGLATKFIDFLGDDPQGRMILDRYAAAGLDFSHLPAPAGTPRSVNLVDREGRRFSFYDGRHPEGLRLPREFYLPYLRRARHVHISRSSHVQDVFADAVRLGRTVSTDLHAWDGKDASAHPWAYGADLVFLSAAAVGERVPEVMRLILAEGRASLVVATDGAAGCQVLQRGERHPRRCPAVVPERPVVDSNGAGDAFLTGFLHARFAGADLDACVLAGSVSGAYACGSPGTHEEVIDAPSLAAAVRRARPAFPAGTAGTSGAEDPRDGSGPSGTDRTDRTDRTDGDGADGADGNAAADGFGGAAVPAASGTADQPPASIRRTAVSSAASREE